MSRTETQAFFEAYRRAGYGGADFEIVQHQAMGADHAFALLHGTLTRSDGRLLQRFGTGYQLIRTAAGPRVLLATAFQENLAAMNT